MSYSVSRAVVDAFYEAHGSRDAERIGAFVDDDVEWSVYGPVEVMQVCGLWRGKAAVIDRWARAIPKVIESSRFERERFLIDGDQSAVFGRVTSKHRPSGRIISHRCAHFITWRADTVMTFRVLNDSLDAAEQFIGRRIDLSDDAAQAAGDIVAL
jgi:ketosteroid isomerase-like protein